MCQFVSHLKVYFLLLVKDMSIGRQEAFEIFTRDYEDNSKIEEQKKILKKHYGEAKALGEGVNQARNKTSNIKIIYLLELSIDI